MLNLFLEIVLFEYLTVWMYKMCLKIIFNIYEKTKQKTKTKQNKKKNRIWH